MAKGPNLAGKVAIVTGGAQGIGEATARRLVEDGAQVVIGDVLDEAGQRVAESLGRSGAFTHLDVTDALQWHDCVAFATATFGSPSILVCNAGVLVTGSFEEASVEDFRRSFEVNTLGSFLGIRAVVGPMRSKGGGSVVIVSSLAGLIGIEGMTAYCTSKAGSTMISRCGAIEFGDDGIRVNSVHPGRIETAMSDAGASGLPAVGSYDGPPLGRVGEVAEVAALVSFLASDDSSYITGGQHVIDGGRQAGQRYPRRATNTETGSDRPGLPKHPSFNAGVDCARTGKALEFHTNQRKTPTEMNSFASRFALVLLDFQPPTLSSLGDQAAAVLDNATHALAWARSQELTVAHVRVGFTESDFHAIPEHNKTFGGLRGGHRFVDGTAECEFVEPLRPESGEICVRKTRFGAFGTTDLEAQLRGAGVDSLILAGQSTSGVVLSTVREAADLDFRLVVLADACGDPDPEVQRYLLSSLFPRQADVITTSALGDLVA